MGPRDRRQRRRRVAVVGGAAAAATRHHDAKQSQQQQEPAPVPQAPAEPAPPVEPTASGGLTPEAMAELKQLGELHDQNVLTDEEFEREKAKLLGTA